MSAKYSAFLTTMLAIAILLGVRETVSANEFYKYTIVAKTGSDGFTSLGNNPSINDSGTVAFMGTTSAGDGIFVRDSAGNLRNISGTNSNIRFDPAVQINNVNKVAATSKTVSAPILTFVRYYNALSTGNDTPIAQGHPSGGHQYYMSQYYHYNVVFSRPTINDSNKVAFSAVYDNKTWLGADTAVTQQPSEIAIGNGNLILRPMIANDGKIVARHGNVSTSPITMYDPNTLHANPIATSANFTAMGRSPGISDDGRIIVFYGDLSTTGAAAINAYQDTLRSSNGEPLHITALKPGPGIFVSMPLDNSSSTNIRSLQRIAGQAGNGNLDPGEYWTDVNHNEIVDIGEDQGIFGSFSADTRVSVSPCASNKHLSVLFNAVDTTGTPGLYRSPFTLPKSPEDAYVAGSATPVIEQGESIVGLAGNVQDIVTYDAVSKHGNITFWVSTTSGAQAVIRASFNDADPELSMADVDRWFNRYITLGDGRSCEIRQENDVKELIDGKEAFAEMARAIRTATGPGHFIYMLDWHMSTSFPLIPDDPSTTLASLLWAASGAGVEIRAMVWATKVPTSYTENVFSVNFINALSSGKAFFDNVTLNYGSHHQKILIVNGSEGLITFCGGVDFNVDRLIPDLEPGDPQHDVHCRIQGPAAYDLLRIFIERWRDYVKFRYRRERNTPDTKLSLLGDNIIPTPITGQTKYVQIGRTYGNGHNHDGIPNRILGNSPSWYSFAPYGEQAARQIFLKAISQARKFIYIEDQYLVSLEARDALIAALPHIQHLTIVIPHGSITTLGVPVLAPNQVNYRRQQFITPLKAAGAQPDGTNKVRVFYLKPIGTEHTYVHSKTWIFDDEFAIIGSANCNRRGWTYDSEVVAGICDKGDGQHRRLPHQLRIRLWAEHLGLDFECPEEQAMIANGVDSAGLWLTPPPEARIAPYDERYGIEASHSDYDWDKYIDPFGG